MSGRQFPNEQGFSVFKLLFWLALLGAIIANGFQGFKAYYNNWQVEDVFTLLVENRASSSETEVREHMKKLFQLKYITTADYPPEFFDHLKIKVDENGLEISSWYDVTIWPLGRVQQRYDDGTYDPEELEGMDVLRDKLRIDLEFDPYASTGPSHAQTDSP